MKHLRDILENVMCIVNGTKEDTLELSNPIGSRIFPFLFILHILLASKERPRYVIRSAEHTNFGIGWAVLYKSMAVYLKSGQVNRPLELPQIGSKYAC